MTTMTKKRAGKASMKKIVTATKASAKPGGVAESSTRAQAKASPAKSSPIVRRDGTGHLDAKYASDLRARSRAGAVDHGVDRAFLRKSKSLEDPLAEGLGEEAVLTMTSGEDQSAELQDVEFVEEIGGPFEVTTAREELARDTDRSNPRGATREPFPRT